MSDLGLLNAISWVSDIVCGGFLLWTLPAFWRVITGRGVRFTDPIKVVALLLLSGRYGFTFERWAFGSHRDFLSHHEVIGRDIVFVWSILTVVAAVVVIRGYRAMAR